MCNYSTKIKHWVRIDDALDLFSEHAIGGIVGLLFNGFFARGEIIAMDGVNLNIQGGWLDHNWKQLYIQFAYVSACCGYVFVVTAGLVKALSLIPGFDLRASERAEIIGMDEDQVRFTFHIFLPLVNRVLFIGRRVCARFRRGSTRLQCLVWRGFTIGHHRQGDGWWPHHRCW